MDLAVPAVVNPVAENAINVIGRQFGYLWNYRKNMGNLEKQVDTLEGKINGMNRAITIATKDTRVISDEANNWLNEARDVSVGARNFIEKHKKMGEMKCLLGLCPNLVSRYQFGRRACKMEKDVAGVITKEGQIREVSFRAVDQENTILSTRDFFSFESRMSILENILKAVQDESKRIVGLYGLGGMGKTTLAKQVASKAKEEKLFEEIVFASVTQKADIKEIQGQIASMLDLKLDEPTVAERAKHIHDRLKGKKVLVILDDLWKVVDLKEVGVPFGTDHMGCKLLLASRSQHVLTLMGTGKDFNLGALDEEEAWTLFKEKVGGGVLKNSDFHNVGNEVAKRCQGLPVLIVTVSASLSKRPQLSAWNDALRQLKEMDNKQMHEIVNSAIESISYNYLKKTHKQLFLLCGIIGGDASIEEVLQFSWGLGLFDEEPMTIQAARDRLHNLIIDLKESCLLLANVDSKNSIKMHDVVRDIAISIGSKDLNMFSMKEHGVELNIWRKEDDLKRYTSMVLRGCPNIPPLLECPSLELFVMSGFSLPSIPESFFEKTVKLKVLGMSQLRFAALPPSLSFLKNLQTLRVNDCDSLGDISVVGELKKLQILSLADTSIEELPSGIGKLSELRSLDVRGCFKLKVIPAGLIEGLTRLEELYVSREFNRWEAEVRVNGSVKTNASLRELKHLHNLCCLEVRANDDTFLLEDLHLEKLERYEIIAGDFDSLWRLDEIEATRKFCVQFSSTSINHLQQGFKRLFERTECLWLGEVKGFPNLKLEKICNGPLMDESFQNLTNVEVSNCNGLKSLFSFSMATRLSRLREIRVMNCDALEAIVAEKNINDDGVNINDGVREEIEFSQLRELTLNRLPNLKNFFFNGEIQNKSHKDLSPEIHTEEEEFKSVLPFFSKVSFPRLEELIVSRISNLTEIPDTCCNLTSLIIYKCKSLKHVFPAHVAPSLNKLEYLKIKDCEAVETIIGDENYEESVQEIIKAARHEHYASATFMFSKLTTMHLEKLPKVKCFYARKHTIECPALTDLSMADCGNLSTFDILSFLSKQRGDQFEKVMSNLEGLSIRSADLENIQRLYDGQFPPHLFSSLISLSIVGSDVFPSEFLGVIHKQLKTFVLHGCSFQEIITYEGEFTSHANDHTLFFPQLNVLSLVKLTQLKYIWKHDQKKPLILNILNRLKYISVDECPLLTNLVQPSTARSLERLIFLTISGCKKMEKVIGDDDEESSRDGDNEIIFPNLVELTLEKLPRLTSFCSSPNYTFNFPEMTWVIVRECPNMKTFSVGTTTTPMLEEVEYEGEQCWEGEDLNTTLQKVCAERNPEKQSEVSENPTESRKGTETGEEGGICVKATAHGKGKGKEVSETTRHSDTSTHHYISQQQTDAGSIASSSKLSSHSQESPRLIPTLPSASLNNQEAEIHGNAAEPTNEHQVVGEISEQGTFTENAIEPRIETEKISDDDPIIEGQVHENAAEKSVKLEVRELASLLPSTSSTSHIEAAAQVPENLAVAQNDSTKAEKTADTFEKERIIAGSVASPEETNPPAQTSLSHSTELEVRRSTSTVESKATYPKRGREIDEEVPQGVKLADICDKVSSQLHPSISNSLQATTQQKDFQELRVTKHFIPLMSKVLEILQTRPLNRMRPEHVKFMEDASRELSHMNFPMDWLCPYIDKAKNCLSAVERTNAISEVELKIAEVESQLQALEESKRTLEESKMAMEEENKVIAFSMDLDKPLYEFED